MTEEQAWESTPYQIGLHSRAARERLLRLHEIIAWHYASVANTLGVKPKIRNVKRLVRPGDVVSPTDFASPQEFHEYVRRKVEQHRQERERLN